MDPHAEAVTKFVLCLLAIAVVAYRSRFARGLKPEQAGQLLGLMAVISALAYTNFGEFNGWPPIHTREMFHYFLGTKYFPELRYDGLYVASIAAQAESGSQYEAQDAIRDLRNNSIRSVTELQPHVTEVRGRFSEERWDQFVTDHRYFLQVTYPVIAFYRFDHGYNPPPNWTFVGRLLSRWIPATEGTLQGLAMLDLLLLGVAFAAIYRTFGARVACLSLIIFGLGAPWRYDWSGGAFLRNDWITALALGLCSLKRDRMVTAGVLLGYAASVRVFPAAFLIGPGLLAIRDITNRMSVRWFARLGVGVAASLLVSFVLGCLTGAGPSVWPEFFKNIRIHNETASGNSVGVESVVLMDAAVSARLEVTGDLVGSITAWDELMDQAAAQRRPLLVGASLLFTLMVLAALWECSLVEASALGMALVFGLMAPSCYYYVFLIFVPLVGSGWRPTIAVLAISAGVFYMRLDPRPFETVYGATSWALLVFFVVWLGPMAFRTLRSLTGRSLRSPG